MRGHLRSQFNDWDAREHGGVDGAIDSYYNMIGVTINKYVRKSNLVVARPAPRWDHKCTNAMHVKDKAFLHRGRYPDKYRTAR